MKRWLHQIGLRCMWVLLLSACGGLASAAEDSAELPAQALEAELTAAAATGDPVAQTRLADIYAGSQDTTNAVVWYRKAAEAGHAQAQWQLGRYYDFGAGPIPVDRAGAMSWYLKSATHGCVNAQLDLGQIYERGVTGEPDYVESYKWYSIAAANNSLLARMSCDQLALKLSPQELEEARKRAGDFAGLTKPAAVNHPSIQEKLPPTLVAARSTKSIEERAVLDCRPSGDEACAPLPKAVPAPDPPIAMRELKATTSRVETFAALEAVNAPIGHQSSEETVAHSVTMTPTPKSVAAPAVPQTERPAEASEPQPKEASSSDPAVVRQNVKETSSRVETVASTRLVPASTAHNPTQEKIGQLAVVTPTPKSVVAPAVPQTERPADASGPLPKVARSSDPVAARPNLKESSSRLETFAATLTRFVTGSTAQNPTQEKIGQLATVTPTPKSVVAPAVPQTERPTEASEPPPKAASSSDPTVARQNLKESSSRLETFAATLTRFVTGSTDHTPSQEKVVQPVALTPTPKSVVAPAVPRDRGLPSRIPNTSGVAQRELTRPSDGQTAGEQAVKRLGQGSSDVRPKAAPSPDPAIVSKLQLKGISSFGTRRVASINNRNLFNGEEASLATDGRPLLVRCLEIKTSSAIVLVDGTPGPIELKLAR